MDSNRRVGKPVKMWGVAVTVRDGAMPRVGDTVDVRAENGTRWTTTVSHIHSFNPKTGRVVLVTPPKSENPHPEYDERKSAEDPRLADPLGDWRDE